MPKRYTSKELIRLAEEFGWQLVSVKGDHHNFKNSNSRYIVTIVHPQKDVPVGRAVDTVKKISGDKIMRYLIVLEPTESGFSVQVPDLAIMTHGINIDLAKQAARTAIRINLDAYQESGQAIPDRLPMEQHFDNPDLLDLLFAYVEVPDSMDRIAA